MDEPEANLLQLGTGGPVRVIRSLEIGPGMAKKIIQSHTEGIRPGLGLLHTRLGESGLDMLLRCTCVSF
jgi:hypothetical protein